MWSRLWNVLRPAMALAIIAAVLAQFLKTAETAAALGRDVPTTVVNFFSFFTILSNVSAAAVLLWAAIWWWTRGRKDAAAEPSGLAIALICTSTYMIVTGIVYNALLRGIQLPQGSEPIPWSNETLHLIGPIFLLLDVLLRPGRRALPWRAVFAVLVFPIVWVAYTMIRGPLTTNPATGEGWWYPYPFLDPHVQPWGYAGVVLYIAGIAIAIAGIACFVVWATRWRVGVRVTVPDPA